LKDTASVLPKAFILIFSAFGFLFVFALTPCFAEEDYPSHLVGIDADSVDWKAKKPDYWRSVLSKKRFRICRKGGTEYPGAGKYDNFYKDGIYSCSSCGLELFSSEQKYNSHTGWPSFWSPIREGVVAYKSDFSFGMRRTEIVCTRCGAHLGHVFEDGPKPTGQRYCVNSICLFHEKPGSKF